MQSILKRVFLNAIAILLVALFIPGLSYGHDLKTLIIAAAVLALANAVLRPILKLLFLPLNIITLGLFGWVISALILYLVTLMVPGFRVTSFDLNLGSQTYHIVEPLAFIGISFALSFASTIIGWIIR